MRAVALVLIVAMGSAAIAEPRSAPADVKTQARKRFSEGKRLQDQRSYDAAIAEYQAAYDLAPHPDLIFNIAQCQRLKGDPGAALASYERYIREAPTGRGVPEARAHIATLGAALAPKEPVPEPQPPAPEPAPVPVAPAQPEALADTPARPVPGRALRIGGLATGGAGLAMLAGGTLFALRARSKADDVNALDQQWDADLYQSGKDASRIGTVLLVAGAAAVVTGGVLYVLGVKAANRERLSLIPGHKSMALQVTF